jgi:aryl-alcohol dehydrogenase-like predicted oxidoreductase
MEMITLPNGLRISPVALGAMNFGTTTTKEQAYAVLDAYMDMGGNFIDTSNNYAHWAGTGDESETVLGEWLQDRGCRDRVVLATKVGFDRHGEGAGLKKSQIEYWVDESLRKLRTDYIDLY